MIESIYQITIVIVAIIMPIITIELKDKKDKKNKKIEIKKRSKVKSIYILKNIELTIDLLLKYCHDKEKSNTLTKLNLKFLDDITFLCENYFLNKDQYILLSNYYEIYNYLYLHADHKYNFIRQHQRENVNIGKDYIPFIKLKNLFTLIFSKDIIDSFIEDIIEPKAYYQEKAAFNNKFLNLCEILKKLIEYKE